MTTNLHLKLQNLKMLVIENVVDVYMNILGCSSTRDMVFIELKIFQVYINASDEFLKFHVSKLP